MKNDDFLNIICLCLYGTFTIFMVYIKRIDKNVYWLFSLFHFHSISCSIILFLIKKYLYAMANYFLFGLIWQIVLVLKIWSRLATVAK